MKLVRVTQKFNTASLHETINLFKKLTIARPSCFAPKKAVVTRFQ
jgi:hypothetical protein